MLPLLSFYYLFGRIKGSRDRIFLVLRYGGESASLFIQMEILTEAGELATGAAAVSGHPSEPSGTVFTCIDHHFPSGQ